MNAYDVEIVKNQIGRYPRGMCDVTSRCEHGFPKSILVRPYSTEQGFFPTIFWLTCPCLKRSISVLESTGFIRVIREKIETDELFRRKIISSNEEYIKKRNELLLGDEVSLEKSMKVGIGGSVDPLKVKCLHMHVSDYISGNDNPIGAECFIHMESQGLKAECDNGACARWQMGGDLSL